MNKIISFVWNNYDNDDRVKKKTTTLSSKNKVVVYCVPKPKDWTTPIKMFGKNIIVKYIKTKNIYDWVFQRVFNNENFWKKHIKLKDLNVDDGELIIDCNDPDTLFAGVYINKHFLAGHLIVYDAHEYHEGNYVFYSGLFQFFNSLICYTSFKNRQRKYIKYADKIIVVSDGIKKMMLEDYKNKKITNQKLFVIPNFSFYEHDIKDFNSRENVATFVGGYNRKGVNRMATCLMELDWKVNFIGNEPKKKQKGINYLGYMSKKQFMMHLQNSKIGILYYDTPNKSFEYSMPNKLSDYIQAGCFVITNQNLKSITQELVNYEVGLACSQFITTEDEDNLLGLNIFKKTAPNKEKMMLAKKNLCWEQLELELLEIYKGVEL